MSNFAKLLCVLALCSLPIVATAGVLDGQSGTLYYDAPNMGTHFSIDPFTAPTTVITLTYGPDLSNVIGGNDIFITFGNIGYIFTHAAFNGEVFNFPGITITSVSYASNFTNVWGWDAHDVWVNWQGLQPDNASFVDFTVSTTPEPGTLILLGSGVVAGLGAIRRRLSA
jgi:hypothetical protein